MPPTGAGKMPRFPVTGRSGTLPGTSSLAELGYGFPLGGARWERTAPGAAPGAVTEAVRAVLR